MKMILMYNQHAEQHRGYLRKLNVFFKQMYLVSITLRMYRESLDYHGQKNETCFRRNFLRRTFARLIRQALN